MTTLLDLRTQVLQRINRPNSAVFPTATLNGFINYSAGALYNELTNTNQDYNSAYYTFTLPGATNIGAPNAFDVTAIGNFWKVLNVEVQAPNASADPWISLRRAPSEFEKHIYARTLIDPFLGIPLCAYLLSGSLLEILPITASAGTYRLKYIPSLPKLVNDSDSIDGYWLSVNGWDEYIILDCAIKCLAALEDDVSVFMAQKQECKALIIKSATPRDVGQPEQIVDIHRNGFGSFGGWGNGW